MSDVAANIRSDILFRQSPAAPAPRTSARRCTV